MNLSDLVKQFSELSEAEFKFLTEKYNFVHSSGLSDYSHPVAKLVEPDLDSLPNFFCFIDRYSKDNIRFEIMYGDRELNIEPRWWFRESDQIFGMWEILESANIPSMNCGKSFVNSSEFMKKTIHDVANILNKNIELFISPREEIINRALELREKYQRDYEIKQRLHSLDRAKLNAAAYFRNKNYKNVIDVLSPFSDILSEADKKMIELSVKYAKFAE